MFGHVALAAAIQGLVWLRTRDPWTGAWVASAWFLSREVTQAEYRWIDRFGEGLRANMPWWGPLDPHVWAKADPWLDWIAPTATAFATAFVAARLTRKSRTRR